MKPFLRFTLAGGFLFGATVLAVRPASATLTWQDTYLPPIILKVAGINGNSANFSIVPGKSIGRVKLGESLWMLQKMMDLPDRSAKRAGGLVEDHWISTDSHVQDPLKPGATSRGGLELSVIYVSGKAIQIGVNCVEFKAPQNISTYTSISKIRKLSRRLTSSSYQCETANETFDLDYYDDVRGGIAYQIHHQEQPDHGPEMIYVHKPQRPVIPQIGAKARNRNLQRTVRSLPKKVVDGVVSRFIAAQLAIEQKNFAESMSQGHGINKSDETGAVEGSRRIVQGDLDNDGDADVAVCYNLGGFGGTNLSLDYLAVFLNDRGHLKPKADIDLGGDPVGAWMLKSIKGGVIQFDTLSYAPQDPKSTPSIQGHAQFVLLRGKLKRRR